MEREGTLKRTRQALPAIMGALTLNVISNLLTEPLRENLGVVGVLLTSTWLQLGTVAILLGIWWRLSQPHTETIAAAVPSPSPDQSGISPRADDLLRWDAACRSDWYIGDRTALRITNVAYALVGNVPVVTMSIQITNMLTTTLRLLDVTDAHVTVEWREVTDGELRGAEHKQFSADEPRRFRLFDVPRGTQSELQITIPVTAITWPSTRPQEWPTRTWRLTGQWSATAYDDQIHTLNVRKPLEFKDTAPPA